MTVDPTAPPVPQPDPATVSTPASRVLRDWLGASCETLAASDAKGAVAGQLLVAYDSPEPGRCAGFTVGLSDWAQGLTDGTSGRQVRLEILAVVQRRWRDRLEVGLEELLVVQADEPRTQWRPFMLRNDVFGGGYGARAGSPGLAPVTTPHALLVWNYEFDQHPIEAGDALVALLQAVPLTDEEFRLARVGDPQQVLQRLIDARADLGDLGRVSVVQPQEAIDAERQVAFGATPDDLTAEHVMMGRERELLGEAAEVLGYTVSAGDPHEPLAVVAEDEPVPGLVAGFTASLNRLDTGATTDDGRRLSFEVVEVLDKRFADAMRASFSRLYSGVVRGEAAPEWGTVVPHLFPHDSDGEHVRCRHGLAIWPELAVEPVDLPHRQIGVLQLVPIATSEGRFVEHFGPGPLVRVFAKTEPYFEDLMRDSVIDLTTLMVAGSDATGFDRSNPIGVRESDVAAQDAVHELVLPGLVTGDSSALSRSLPLAEAGTDDPKLRLWVHSGRAGVRADSKLVLSGSLNRVHPADEPVHRCELVVLVGDEWLEVAEHGLMDEIEWVTFTGNQPAAGQLRTRLFRGVACGHGLLVGARDTLGLAPLELDDRTIDFLQVLPITEEELAWAREWGTDELAARLRDVDLTRLDRESVV